MTLKQDFSWQVVVMETFSTPWVLTVLADGMPNPKCEMQFIKQDKSLVHIAIMSSSQLAFFLQFIDC